MSRLSVSRGGFLFVGDPSADEARWEIHAALDRLLARLNGSRTLVRTRSDYADIDAGGRGRRR